MNDDDGYDEMSRDELLYRCRDWRKLANDRTLHIRDLEHGIDLMGRQLDSCRARLADLEELIDQNRTLYSAVRTYIRTCSLTAEQIEAEGVDAFTARADEAFQVMAVAMRLIDREA